MSDYSTTARINLEVNGTRVSTELNDLNRKLERLHSKYADAISRGDKKLQEKLSKSLSDVKNKIKKIETASQHAATVLSHLDKATPRELKQTLKTLNRELQTIDRGSDAWNEHCEKIKKVKEELDKVNEAVKLQESGTNEFLNFFTELQGTWIVLDGFFGKITDAGIAAVQTFADLEGEMANVRKYTGLTAEDVAVLNEEFKKIDTRTSINDLHKLAQEAGRLGKTSKEDILGFVRAADKINVALDDLGDGATLTISKLTSIFGDEERLGTERAMLAVGSVVNELSQNCSAAAPYLAEFASRLGGVGSQANMTIPQIMSYAAVLDSSNQNVEASATALSQLIVKMMQDPARFAAATGMELENFSKTLKTDTNAALIMFFERLREIGDMNALAPVFETMKLDGTRATAVLAALASKVEMLKWEQEEANNAFNEATSVGKEFNVQNSTVQASLDKARNGFNQMAAELGEKLMPVVRYALSSTSALMRVIKILVDFFIEYKGIIISLSVAVAQYTLIVKAHTLAVQAENMATAVGNTLKKAQHALLLLLKIGWFNLTNQTYKAAKAQVLWNNTFKANPIGLLLSALTLAAGALLTYWSHVRKVRMEEQEARKEREKYVKSLTDISNISEKYANEELTNLSLLYNAATDETKSKEERIAATKKLQSLYPDYFGQLSTEAIMVGNAKAKYDDLRVSILEAAKARAAADKIKENQEKIIDLEFQKKDAEDDVAKKEKELRDARNAYDELNTPIAAPSSSARAFMPASVTYRPIFGAQAKIEYADSALEESRENLKAIEDKIILLNNANKELEGKYGAAIVENQISPANLIVSNTIVNKFKEQEEWKAKEQTLNRIAYAKGEKDFEAYTSRMEEIEVEFNKKKLARTDLTESERLSIEADYQEASANQQKTALKRTEEQENQLYNSILSYEKQRYLDGEHDYDAYSDVIHLAELAHLRRMINVYEEGSQERINAEQKYKDALVRDKQQQHEKFARDEKEHQRNLNEIKKQYFGLNKKEQKAIYDAQLKLLEEAYNQEIKACADNAEEKLRIEEAYKKAKSDLENEYLQNGTNNLKDASNEIVSWLQSDVGDAFTTTVETLVSSMSSLFSQLTSFMQAELDLQVATIEKRYDKEIELAEGNTGQVKKLEEEKEKKIAKMKNDANKKMYAMQIFMAIAQTATNAINAYGSVVGTPFVGPVLAPIAAAMAVAAGGMQIATIKKQQQASEAQGYSKGGFTTPGAVDDVVGVVHAGEWVASQKLLSNPDARPLINALDYAQRTNSYGTLRAEDVSKTITAPTVIAKNFSDKSDKDASVSLYSALNRLNQRLNEPFVTVNTVTGDAGINKAQDDYNRLIRNKTPKSKRK